MPTFAVGIDENPLYATRAEQDKNGDQIDLTYAKKSEVPSQLTAASGLTIVSDVVGAKVDGTTIIVNQNGELESIGGSGGGEVFYATYGVTTFNEIVTANQAGKAVVLQKATAFAEEGYSLPLQSVFISNVSDSSYAYFSKSPRDNYQSGDLSGNSVYKVDGNNRWTRTSVWPITYPTSADVGKVLTCSRAGRVSWNEATAADIHTSTNLKGDGSSSDPLDLNSVIDIGGYPDTSHHTYINDKGEVSGLNIAPDYYYWDITPVSGLRIFSKYDDDGIPAPNNRLIGRDIIALHGIETSASIWNEAAAMDEYPISAGPGIKIEDVDDVTVFSTSGVMMEADIGYNGQGEISGYNGSPIMTVDSEKQWLTHDDTICHVTNSAQYAFGVNVPVVAQAMGTDETILYSSSSTSVVTSFTLSEKPSRFDRIRITGYVNGGRFSAEIPSDTGIDANIRFACTSYAPDSYGHPLQIYGASYTSNDGLSYRWYRETLRWFNQSTPGTVAGTTNEVKPVFYKIVGIGRKEN